MPVPAPAGGVLFFACPKKSTQKKRHTDAALILRSEGFERGFPKGLPSPYVKRAASLPRPCGPIRSNLPVLGAAEGKKTNLAFADIVSLQKKWLFLNLAQIFTGNQY